MDAIVIHSHYVLIIARAENEPCTVRFPESYRRFAVTSALGLRLRLLQNRDSLKGASNNGMTPWPRSGEPSEDRDDGSRFYSLEMRSMETKK